MKNKWIHYHATRLNLIDSLNSHLETCRKTNVYHPETNQCDSHSLMNEDMGVPEIIKLIEKLKREVVSGFLMTNPRVTGFPSFAKAVLHFLQDKKAPKTKKNLYNYLVKKGVYDKVSWGLK